MIGNYFITSLHILLKWFNYRHYLKCDGASWFSLKLGTLSFGGNLFFFLSAPGFLLFFLLRSPFSLSGLGPSNGSGLWGGYRWSFSYCLLASSNDKLPLNDGAKPLNTFEGGLKLSPLGGGRLFGGGWLGCLRGDLLRRSLKGLDKLNPLFGTFWGLLFGRLGLSCSG